MKTLLVIALTVVLVFTVGPCPALVVGFVGAIWAGTTK